MLSRVVVQLTFLLVSAMAILTISLAWISLQWPIIGDAGMFHFAASQFSLGEVPYRDFIDMNMPLIYLIHFVVIAIGGMDDLTFRIFDLSTSVLIGIIAVALVWPRGRSLALLAALTIIAAHLLDGPQAAGERDFLFLIPVLTIALLTSWSAERPHWRTPLLILAGCGVGLATLLKPTAVLLLVMPVFINRFSWKNTIGVCSGFLAVILSTLFVLNAMGSLSAFIDDLQSYVPYYKQLAQKPALLVFLIAGKYAMIGAGGLIIAAAYGLLEKPSPRARCMIICIVYGVLHFVLQGKGFYYHVYPLVAALACFGCWSIPRLPARLSVIVFVTFASVLGVRAYQAGNESRVPGSQIMPAPVSRAIEASLTQHLQRGARVQMLDMSGGAFLAMARAGMRQATPYAYWAFLDPGKEIWRETFIKDLRSSPPDAILVTDATWPSQDGFKALDDWPTMKQQIDCCFRLADSQTVTTVLFPWAASAPSVSWRLYVPRAVDVGRS